MDDTITEPDDAGHDDFDPVEQAELTELHEVLAFQRAAEEAEDDQ